MTIRDQQPVRVRFPPAKLAAQSRWFSEVADALNILPPFSTFSLASPNSNVSAVPGTIGVNLNSASSTRFWVKNSGFSNLGWSQGAASAQPAGHVLATTAALGPEHTVSALTARQVLVATGATTALFRALTAADVEAGTFPAGAFVFQGAVSGITTLASGALTTTGVLTLTTTTSPQATVRYDSSNRLDVTISSAGAVTLDAVGASAGFTLSDALTVSGLGTFSAGILVTESNPDADNVHISPSSAGHAYFKATPNGATNEAGIALARVAGTSWFMYRANNSDNLQFNFTGDKITFGSGGQGTFAGLLTATAGARADGGLSSGVAIAHGGTLALSHATNPYIDIRKTDATAYGFYLELTGGTMRVYSQQLNNMVQDWNATSGLSTFNYAATISGLLTASAGIATGVQVMTAGLLKLGVASGNQGAALQFLAWAGVNKNWQISSAYIGGDILEWTPSTVAGGSTFTTSVMTLSPAGALTLSDQLIVTRAAGSPARFRYDASNYLDIDVSSAGVVTYNAVGASQRHDFADNLNVTGTMKATADVIAGLSLTVQFSGASEWEFYAPAAGRGVIRETGVADRFAVLASGIAIASGQKHFLDDLAGGGDTYLVESSANVMDLVVGGNTTLQLGSGSLLATLTSGTINYASSGQVFTVTYTADGSFSFLLKNTSNTSNAASHASTEVAGSSAADSAFHTRVVGVGEWISGLDNSDSDTYKLSWTTNAGTNPVGTGLVALAAATDGRVFGTALHNVGTVTGTTNQYIASGTYTPALTNVTNVAASTAYACQWIRVGNVVTVSGKVDVDPTAAVASVLGIALPIASAFTAQEHCGGTASLTGAATVIDVGAIRADATNDRAELTWLQTADLSNQSWYFSFTYVIL